MSRAWPRRLRARATSSAASVAFAGFDDVAEIGVGAFASVYRATEVDTGRHVALKLLRVSAALPHVMDAFERETRSLGLVSSHPNIVTLYRTLTTSDAGPVLVLELCHESTADRLRRQGSFPPQEAVAIAIKVAGALETAHWAGLLHRDLKPGNILITFYGEPALAGFGVAALQASAPATDGTVGFTTPHAPPEVLEGHHLSPATDVYGLASTLYQLVAGRAPFAAFEGEAPASVILRILRDPVTPLRLGTVPIELSDVLEAAMAKDPGHRPASAAAFAEALQSVARSCGWSPTPYAVWAGPPAPLGFPAPAPGVPVDLTADSSSEPRFKGVEHREPR